MLAEVEATVNCRPLTQLCEVTEDAEALTPSHLIGKRVVGLPAKTSGCLPSSTAPDLRRRVKYRDEPLHRLWKRWKKEYLLLLRSAHHCRPSSSSQQRVGDLVIKDNVPALQCKLGRVVEAFPGRDGIERYFKIAFPNGQQVRRAAQRLYPLEASEHSAAPGGC